MNLRPERRRDLPEFRINLKTLNHADRVQLQASGISFEELEEAAAIDGQGAYLSHEDLEAFETWQEAVETRFGPETKDLGYAQRIRQLFVSLDAKQKREADAEATTEPAPPLVGIEEAVDNAVDQHPDVLAAEARVNEAREGARVSYSKNVFDNGSQGRGRAGYPTNIGIGVAVRPWSGELLTNEQEMALSDISVAEAELEAIRRQVEFEIRTRLTDLYAVAAEGVALQERLTATRDHKRHTDIRRANRWASTTDVNQIDADADQIESAIADNAIELQNIYFELKQYFPSDAPLWDVIDAQIDLTEDQSTVEPPLTYADAEITDRLITSPLMEKANEQWRRAGLYFEDTEDRQKFLNNLTIRPELSLSSIGSLVSYPISKLNQRKNGNELRYGQEAMNRVAADYVRDFTNAKKTVEALLYRDKQLHGAEQRHLANIQDVDNKIRQAQSELYPGEPKTRALSALYTDREYHHQKLIEVREQRQDLRLELQRLFGAPPGEPETELPQMPGFEAAPGALGPVSERFDPDARRKLFGRIADWFVELFKPNKDTWTYDRSKIVEERTAPKLWASLSDDQRDELAALVDSKTYKDHRDVHVQALADAIYSRASYIDAPEQALADADALLRGLEGKANAHPRPEKTSDLGTVNPGDTDLGTNGANLLLADARGSRVGQYTNETLDLTDVDVARDEQARLLEEANDVEDDVSKVEKEPPFEEIIEPDDTEIESVDLTQNGKITLIDHPIVWKDSVGEIAKLYNTTVQAIKNANPDMVGVRIIAGETLKIPVPTEQAERYQMTAKGHGAFGVMGRSSGGSDYRGPTFDYPVKDGDNLWDIAKAHGTDIETLFALNSIPPNGFIAEGQKLQIPDPDGQLSRRNANSSTTVGLRTQPTEKEEARQRWGFEAFHTTTEVDSPSVDPLYIPSPLVMPQDGTRPQQFWDPISMHLPPVALEAIESVEVGRIDNVRLSAAKQKLDEYLELFDTKDNWLITRLIWGDVSDEKLADSYAQLLGAVKVLNGPEADEFLKHLHATGAMNTIAKSSVAAANWASDRPSYGTNTVLHALLSKSTDGFASARAVVAWRSVSQKSARTNMHYDQTIDLGQRFLSRELSKNSRLNFVKELSNSVRASGLNADIRALGRSTHIVADPVGVLAAMGVSSLRDEPWAVNYAVDYIDQQGKLSPILIAALRHENEKFEHQGISDYSMPVIGPWSTGNPGALMDLLSTVRSAQQAVGSSQFKADDVVMNEMKKMATNTAFKDDFPWAVLDQDNFDAMVVQRQFRSLLSLNAKGASEQAVVNAQAQFVYTFAKLPPTQAQKFIMNLKHEEQQKLVEIASRTDQGPEVLGAVVGQMKDFGQLTDMITMLARGVDQGNLGAQQFLDVSQALFTRRPPLSSGDKVQLVNALSNGLRENASFDPRGALIANLVAGLQGQSLIQAMDILTQGKNTLDLVMEFATVPLGQAQRNQERFASLHTLVYPSTSTNDVRPLVGMINAVDQASRKAYGYSQTKLTEYRAKMILSGSRAILHGIGEHQAIPVWSIGLREDARRVNTALVSLLESNTNATIDQMFRVDATGEGLTLLLTTGMGLEEWSKFSQRLDPFSDENNDLGDRPAGRFNTVVSKLRHGENLRSNFPYYFWNGTLTDNSQVGQVLLGEQVRQRLGYFEGCRTGAVRMLVESAQRDFNHASNKEGTNSRFSREFASFITFVFRNKMIKPLETTLKLVLIKEQGDAVADVINQRHRLLTYMQQYNQKHEKMWKGDQQLMNAAIHDKDRFEKMNQFFNFMKSWPTHGHHFRADEWGSGRHGNSVSERTFSNE